MPDYFGTSRAINQLAQTIGGINDRSLRHDEAMNNFGIQRAQQALNRTEIQGKQDIALKGIERQKWMTDAVTVGQAIDTQPEWSPEQRQKIKAHVQSMFGDKGKDILDIPTTRQNLQTMLRQMSSDRATAQYRKGMLDLSRQRLESSQGTKFNASNQKYFDSAATQNIMGKYGISQGLDGNLESPAMTPEQAQMLKAEASNAGLNVYFDQGTTEDVGNRLNPFDNKTYQTFTVKAIAPVGNAPGRGLINPQVSMGTPNDQAPIKQPNSSSAASELLTRAKKSGTPDLPQEDQIMSEQKPQLVQRGNKFYKQTSEGLIEATQDEIDQFRSNPISDFANKLLQGGTPQPRRGLITGTSKPRQRGY